MDGRGLGQAAAELFPETHFPPYGVLLSYSWGREWSLSQVW